MEQLFWSAHELGCSLPMYTMLFHHQSGRARKHHLLYVVGIQVPPQGNVFVRAHVMSESDETDEDYQDTLHDCHLPEDPVRFVQSVKEWLEDIKFPAELVFFRCQPHDLYTEGDPLRIFDLKTRTWLKSSYRILSSRTSYHTQLSYPLSIYITSHFKTFRLVFNPLVSIDHGYGPEWYAGFLVDPLSRDGIWVEWGTQAPHQWHERSAVSLGLSVRDAKDHNKRKQQAQLFWSSFAHPP
jgi:hypothetical protein